MDTPTWVLAIIYWLHMLATVAWIGGLTALVVFVLPAAQKNLSVDAYAGFLFQLESRLQRLGWLCMGVLIVTGMFQLSAHPNYEGFLAITTPWASALLVKHLAVGVMIGLSAYITWGLLPALSRIEVLKLAGKSIDTSNLRRLQQREGWLMRANLLIAIIILLLTAWARAS